MLFHPLVLLQLGKKVPVIVIDQISCKRKCFLPKLSVLTYDCYTYYSKGGPSTAFVWKVFVSRCWHETEVSSYASSAVVQFVIKNW